MRLFLWHLRRSYRLALLVSAGLFAFHALMVRVFSVMAAQGGTPPAFGRFLPKGVQTFLGMDKLPMNSLNGFLAVAYQHPFQLAALLAVPIAVASGLLAGEVEKKTIALLIVRRVRRVGIVFSAALVMAFWAALLTGACIGGTFAGIAWMHIRPAPAPQMMWQLGVNLYVLTLAVSGLALACSAPLSERSDAAGWAVTIVLVMYVWNFLSQVWPAAKASGPYSLFHYYTPVTILTGNAQLVYNLQLLGAVGLAGLLYAEFVYWLRDFNV